MKDISLRAARRPVLGATIFLLGMLVILLAACSGGSKVVGTVNGEPITREMFDANLIIPKVASEEIGQVPPVIPKIAILDQVVNNLLLLQSAREQGIQVTQDQLKTDIGKFIGGLGTTPEEFEARLKENGVPWSAFVDNVEQTLIIETYKNEYLLTHVMEDEREEFLNSWLIVQTQQSTIEFDQGFLNEVNSE
jgi:parvulin-like peptidyl-prolyl isomerase